MAEKLSRQIDYRLRFHVSPLSIRLMVFVRLRSLASRIDYSLQAASHKAEADERLLIDFRSHLPHSNAKWQSFDQCGHPAEIKRHRHDYRHVSQPQKDIRSHSPGSIYNVTRAHTIDTKIQSASITRRSGFFGCVKRAHFRTKSIWTPFVQEIFMI